MLDNWLKSTLSSLQNMTLASHHVFISKMLPVQLLWLTLCGAARLDRQPTVVDCSGRNPPPEPEVGFDSQWLHEEMQKEGEKRYLIAVIDVNGEDAEQCNYFVYEQYYGKFVPLKFTHAFRETTEGMEKEHFCYIDREDPEFCEIKKGNKVWTYATEWTNDLCIEKLCQVAKTGQWRRAKWFKETKQKSAKKMPWHRRGSPDSVGYEDVFKRCWPGPKGFGKLLGDFEDFSERHGLTNPSGSFNKKVCGCETEDTC